MAGGDREKSVLKKREGMGRAAYGGMCTKAKAPRVSAGPQANSMALDSLLIQSATEESTQSGRGVELGFVETPPVNVVNH